MSVQTMIPIDHIIYAAPDLQTGMDEIEKLLGVRPIQGGRHPQYGTHNALLSLGNSIYLEVIAPDHGLAPPFRGRWLQDHFEKQPHIATWVLRSANIEQDAAYARAQGIPMGRVSDGKREKTDGTVLAWQLTDPYAMPMDGAIPFLISWGNTPHPAASVPEAGFLTGLTIAHPEAEGVRKQLEILGVQMETIKDPEVKITARIRQGNRIIHLQ